MHPKSVVYLEYMTADLPKALNDALLKTPKPRPARALQSKATCAVSHHPRLLTAATLRRAIANRRCIAPGSDSSTSARDRSRPSAGSSSLGPVSPSACLVVSGLRVHRALRSSDGEGHQHQRPA